MLPDHLRQVEVVIGADQWLVLMLRKCLCDTFGVANAGFLHAMKLHARMLDFSVGEWWQICHPLRGALA